MAQAKIKRDRQKAIEAAAKHPAPTETPSQTATKAAPLKIFIDVAGVPLLRRQDPRFKSLFAMMENKLADPREVEAICIHESMHMYYLIKAGVDDFIYAGPTITYDEKEGFDHTGASVQAKSFDRALAGQTPALNWAFTVAKACVGGGIGVEVLCPNISDNGAIEDQKRFDTMYDLLVKSGLSVPKDEFKKEAERIVRAELKAIPDLEEFIRKTADEFVKHQLFTWV
jgi:hypothetical protein